MANELDMLWLEIEEHTRISRLNQSESEGILKGVKSTWKSLEELLTELKRQEIERDRE